VPRQNFWLLFSPKAAAFSAVGSLTQSHWSVGAGVEQALQDFMQFIFIQVLPHWPVVAKPAQSVFLSTHGTAAAAIGDPLLTSAGLPDGALPEPATKGADGAGAGIALAAHMSQDLLQFIFIHARFLLHSPLPAHPEHSWFKSVHGAAFAIS